MCNECSKLVANRYVAVCCNMLQCGAVCQLLTFWICSVCGKCRNTLINSRTHVHTHTHTCTHTHARTHTHTHTNTHTQTHTHKHTTTHTGGATWDLSSWLNYQLSRRTARDVHQPLVCCSVYCSVCCSVRCSVCCSVGCSACCSMCCSVSLRCCLILFSRCGCSD